MHRTCCPALVLTSLGLGAVFVPLTLIATTGLENEDQGLASGLFNTSQQIGGALGLAILASLAASKTANATGVSQQAALVEGFHVAFAGGAAFVVLASAGSSRCSAAATSSGSRPRRPPFGSPDALATSGYRCRRGRHLGHRPPVVIDLW